MVKYIPDITDERLNELARRIKPIVKFKKQLYYIRKCNLRTTAFQWAPKPTSRVQNIARLDDITTYHKHAYYGLFKPSIAEVLAQIPEHLVDQVCAFRIVWQPENINDFRAQWDVVENSHHKTKTRLYKHVQPQSRKAAQRYFFCDQRKRPFNGT